MKKLLAVLCFLVLGEYSFSQMGIGTLTPNKRSLLELYSTPGKPRGLLIPRMPTTLRRGMEIGVSDSVGIPLSSEHNSLLLFDNTQDLFYGYVPDISPVDKPVNYDISGRDEAKNRVWQILNPWKTQYAFDGFNTRVNLIQDTVANGFVGIGWVDYTESPTFPLHVKGDGYFENSNLTVDKTITTTTVKADTVGEDEKTFLFGYGSVPVGTVLPWSGEWDADVEAIMDKKGWVLCDDRKVKYQDVMGREKEVPDLRGRFIVGYDSKGPGLADPDYADIGITGPANPNDENDYGIVDGVARNQFYELEEGGKRVKLLEPAMPSHDHNVVDLGHDHGGGADHNHRFKFPTVSGRNGGRTGFSFASGINSTGNRTYTSETSRANIPNDNADIQQDTKGGLVWPLGTPKYGQPAETAMPIENRPPYYVLAYIIRVK